MGDAHKQQDLEARAKFAAAFAAIFAALAGAGFAGLLPKPVAVIAACLALGALIAALMFNVQVRNARAETVIVQSSGFITRIAGWVGELWGVERSEAEAVYDGGRERCVEFILELARGFEQLAAGNARLDGRVRRLEEQTRSDSRNSSVAPSADSPKTRQQRRAEARVKAKELLAKGGGGRKAWGQVGHRWSGRKLSPDDQIDEIVDHYPDACDGCGHEFAQSEKLATRRPGRHQVVELPPIAVRLCEHRTHRLRCPDCETKTTGVLPGEVAGSAFGPALQAAVVTMTARNRVSRRDMSELARDLFGLGLSVGSVDAICQRASAVLAEPHEALVASVLASPVLNADETGWQTAGEGRMLWTATTERAAIFRIAEDRHADRLDELIGADYAGIVSSDRWWAYDHLDCDCRQACWQHLKRDFRRHAEGLAEQETFGETGLALTKRLFATWHAFDEHQDRDRLAAEMASIQTQLRALLEHAGRKSARTRYHRRFAKICSRSGPRYGRSSPRPASSRPTTPQNAHFVAPSSLASSPTAPAPTAASASSNAPSRPRSPAAYKPAPCSPTSPSCSALTPAATRSPHSHNHGD